MATAKMPYKDLLPPLSTEDYESLKQSVKAEGVRDAVWKDELGNVLDGHHRLSIDPNAPTRIVKGSKNWTEAQRKAFVWKANFERRQLSPEQRSEANKARRLIAKELSEQFTQKQIAVMLGASREAVSDWLASISNGSSTNANNPPARDHRVSVPKHEYDLIAERVSAGESQAQVASDYGISQPRVSNIVKIVEARQEQDAAPPPSHTPGAPKATYRCIVIDPPWPVEKIEREERPNQGKRLDYHTMSLEEIEALPVAKLSRDAGCHLYLWVTHKFLPAGLRLVEAWGFRYVCLMTWVKPTGMTPYSWMYNTEHVIFAVKGSLPVEQKGQKLAFEAPVKKGSHSAKPDVFFDRVIKATPGPRLEMFARKPHEGFESWGNQAE